MHFRLIPQRRFLGHSLPLWVLKSQSPLSVVRASLTARSAATIFRSWRLQATSAILQGNNRASGLNTHALLRRCNWGENEASEPGMLAGEDVDDEFGELVCIAGALGHFGHRVEYPLRSNSRARTWPASLAISRVAKHCGENLVCSPSDEVTCHRNWL